MNDFLKTLMNIRSLRAALRELSFEQLVEIREKFEEIFAEREQQETKLREESAERLQKLAEFTEMLLAVGLRSFSMHPSQLPAIKQRILRTEIAPLAPHATLALEAEDPRAVWASGRLRALTAIPQAV